MFHLELDRQQIHALIAIEFAPSLLPFLQNALLLVGEKCIGCMNFEKRWNKFDRRLRLVLLLPISRRIPIRIECTYVGSYHPSSLQCRILSQIVMDTNFVHQALTGNLRHHQIVRLSQTFPDWAIQHHVVQDEGRFEKQHLLIKTMDRCFETFGVNQPIARQSLNIQADLLLAIISPSFFSVVFGMRTT